MTMTGEKTLFRRPLKAAETRRKILPGTDSLNGTLMVKTLPPASRSVPTTATTLPFASRRWRLALPGIKPGSVISVVIVTTVVVPTGTTWGETEGVLTVGAASGLGPSIGPQHKTTRSEERRVGKARTQPSH